MIDGVDISHWQDGELNYGAAKRAGVKFLYHKATEGDTYTDPKYAKRRKEAAAAGIPFGAYHFARPEVGSAVAEARRFLKVASPKPGDMIPMLDLETNDEALSRGQMTAWVGQFVGEVAKAGFKVIIYTPYDLDKSFGCPLWVARYNDSMLQPNVPKPWKKWDIWQFSDGVHGYPKSVPGFGAVDINTVREGFDLDSLLIPKKTETITIQHSSMEVFDTNKQQAADAKKVLNTGADIICGTEANDANMPLRVALRLEATRRGYFIHFGGRGGSWIAVRKSLCVNRVKPIWGFQKVFDGSGKSGDPNGPYGVRGIVYGTFRHEELGVVSIASAHFLTKGRTRSQTPRGRFNHYDMNTRYIKEVGAWAKTYGKKTAISFFTADTNIPDDKMDVFRGEPLTTCWDELVKYPDTGHGTIDVIASYDKDSRVKCIKARTRPDLNLNSDHKTIEAVYEVQKLKIT